MIDKDGDAAIGVQAEEPVFLLVVGHDVAEKEEEGQEKISQTHTNRIGVRVDLYNTEVESNNVQERISPLGAINIMQLLEHNLHLLPIGRAHRDEMKTLTTRHDPSV